MSGLYPQSTSSESFYGMKVISGWSKCVLVGQNNFWCQTMKQSAPLVHASPLWSAGLNYVLWKWSAGQSMSHLALLSVPWSAKMSLKCSLAGRKCLRIAVSPLYCQNAALLRPFCYCFPSPKASVHATAQNEKDSQSMKNILMHETADFMAIRVWGKQINRLCSLTYTRNQSDRMPTEMLAHLLAHSLSNVRFHLTADGRMDSLPHSMIVWVAMETFDHGCRERPRQSCRDRHRNRETTGLNPFWHRRKSVQKCSKGGKKTAAGEWKDVIEECADSMWQLENALKKGCPVYSMPVREA